MESKWVSVEDRLPDPKGGDFLVCDSDYCCTVACFNDYGNWVTFAESWHPDDITHWMKLPKKPSK